MIGFGFFIAAPDTDIAATANNPLQVPTAINA
jgi:hypothetical protein